MQLILTEWKGLVKAKQGFPEMVGYRLTWGKNEGRASIA
jgi:hypothetical protein